jgi:rhodanese-related sulfurtransferase
MKDMSAKDKIKQSMVEACIILALSAVLGFAVNSMDAHGIRISGSDPLLEYVPDDGQGHELPHSHVHAHELHRKSAHDTILEPVYLDDAELDSLMQIDDVLLIDVRAASDFSKVRIRGSINVPIQVYDQYLNDLPRDRWLICYCAGPPCDSSEFLALELIDAGYNRVAVYHGGIRGLIQAGLDTTRDGGVR